MKGVSCRAESEVVRVGFLADGKMALKPFATSPNTAEIKYWSRFVPTAPRGENQFPVSSRQPSSRIGT